MLIDDIYSWKTLKLHLLSHEDGASKGTEFVIDLLELIFGIALRHDAATSLEPEFASACHEGADSDGLVEAAV